VSCGLFIDEELPFLAAKPDRHRNDTIVEIKCPFYGKNLTPYDVIKQKAGVVGSFFIENKKNNKLEEKAQILLSSSGPTTHLKTLPCVFALWTPLGMKTFEILRDDQFWERERNGGKALSVYFIIRYYHYHYYFM
jgi:hypothetical protein